MKDLVAEIKLVRARQDRLVEEVGVLGGRISALEREVSQSEPAPEVVAPAPSFEPNLPAVPSVDEKPLALAVAPTPPPIPKRKPAAPVPSVPAPEPAPPPKAEAESLEVRLGTVWAVRLGIFIFLSGLVFLGSYTYENYISHFGPFARALMLYAIGGGLIATGWLLEKREQMVNFARVVLAGGLAATFFTTWASHYLEPLRWIESASLDAALLLGWTAVMGWLADRRKSQLLAGFSLLLAYYTCVITPAAGFSLVAVLVLSVAAVFFLVRNGWTALALAALPATYGAFAFWQFAYPVMSGQSLTIATGTGLGFLCCYWVVFTAAIFATPREVWREGVSAAWAGLNNLALFALGTAVLVAREHAGLWIWSVTIGLVSLALAYAAERRTDRAASISRVYLATGLLFFTVGIFQKWSGFSLALLLAAESLVMLLVSHRHWRPWYLAGAVVTSALAMITGVVALEGASLWIPVAAVAAIQFVEGWLDSRRDKAGPVERVTELVFAGFGTLTTLALVVAKAAPTTQCWWLAGLAVLAIPGFSLHRYRALNYGAHVWLAAAVVLGLTRYFIGRSEMAPVLLVGLASIVIAQWWQREKSLPAPGGSHSMLQLPFAVVEGLAAFALLFREAPEPWRPLIMTAVALGFLIKAAGIGSAWSAGVGLILGLAAAAGLAVGMLHLTDYRWLDLGTITALAAFTGGLATYGRMTPSWLEEEVEPWRRKGARMGVILMAHATLGVALVWIFRYQTLSTATWIVALMGFAIVAAARFQPACRPAAMAGAGVLTLAVIAFCLQLPGAGGLAASSVVVPLVLLATRRIFRPEHPAENWLLLTGIGLLWWYLTARLIDLGGGYAMTIGWGLLAAVVFAVGLFARDRGYRWSGLTILAAALVRLIFFDLWQLGTLTRVVSCMVLGLLLVGIGFVYNRFSERVKRYL